MAMPSISCARANGAEPGILGVRRLSRERGVWSDIQRLRRSTVILWLGPCLRETGLGRDVDYASAWVTYKF